MRNSNPSKPDGSLRPWAQPARTRSPSTLARLLADPAVWKLTIMTSALNDSERRHYREAFADFAAGRGLQVWFSAGTTCIAPTTAPITSEDRGAVLGWLCSCTEVHFIHVRRASPSRSLAVACTAERRNADQAAGRRQSALQADIDLPGDSQPTLTHSEAPRHEC